MTRNILSVYKYTGRCVKLKWHQNHSTAGTIKQTEKTEHISEGNFLKLLKSFKVWVKWWKSNGKTSLRLNVYIPSSA